MAKKPAERAVEGRTRTMEEKLRIVMEAAAIPPNELGAYFRREGVHAAELEQWRTAAKSAFEDSAPKPAGRGAEAKRIKDLERELRRKDKALAEAAALLVLKKKLSLPNSSGLLGAPRLDVGDVKPVEVVIAEGFDEALQGVLPPVASANDALKRLARLG